MTEVKMDWVIASLCCPIIIPEVSSVIFHLNGEKRYLSLNSAQALLSGFQMRLKLKLERGFFESVFNFC